MLKGNSTSYDTESFLAFYKPQGVTMGFASSGIVTNYYYGGSDTSSPLSGYTGIAYYQGLSTSQKQW